MHFWGKFLAFVDVASVCFKVGISFSLFLLGASGGWQLGSFFFKASRLSSLVSVLWCSSKQMNDFKQGARMICEEWSLRWKLMGDYFLCLLHLQRTLVQQSWSIELRQTKYDWMYQVDWSTVEAGIKLYLCRLHLCVCFFWLLYVVIVHWRC